MLSDTDSLEYSLSTSPSLVHTVFGCENGSCDSFSECYFRHKLEVIRIGIGYLCKRPGMMYELVETKRTKLERHIENYEKR